MSSGTIRKGSGRKGGSGAGSGGGRTIQARPTAKGRRRGVRRQTRLDRLIARLPVSRETLARILSLMIAGLFVAGLWMGASFLGLPAMAGQELSALAARAGFQVAKVEVQGIRRMDEMPVYALALDEIDRSMLSVDLGALRGRVMTLGWVKDARVTRRLPDTLVVDVVERTPVAVWQHGGQLSLIDVDGVALEDIDGRAMPDLPLVVGPDANRETRGLQALMETAPALKPLLAGATWVGNRRWDLRFQSGETLLLPEGSSTAAAALMKFAEMEGVNRLLGRGILRFDMRDPERFVLRLPSDRKTAEQAKAEQAKVEGAKTDQPAKDKPTGNGAAAKPPAGGEAQG